MNSSSCLSVWRGTFSRSCRAMIARGVEPNKDQDIDAFERWALHAVDTARELAKYQSPQFRAVAVVAQDARPMRNVTDAREKLRRLVIDTIINSEPKDDEIDTVGPLITAPTSGKPN
jgi:hypothetical protein